jgi:hypothetical protein
VTYQDVVATALTRGDLADDVRGINASIELAPEDPRWRLADRAGDRRVQFIDLVWHECEFREGDSFAYAV